MRSVLKVTYAPLMLLVYNGAAVWLVTLKAAWFWLLPLLLAAIATSFVVERIIPYEPAWNRDRGDTGRDLIYAVAYEASVYLSVALIPLLTLLSPATGLWPSMWPLWGQLLLAVMVADFGITLWGRQLRTVHKPLGLHARHGGLRASQTLLQRRSRNRQAA